MQDYVKMALLAHAAGRSSVLSLQSSSRLSFSDLLSRFVFDDYVWNPDRSVYSDYNGKLIPSRIPLTALVGGKYYLQFLSLYTTSVVMQDQWLVVQWTPETAHLSLSADISSKKYAQSQ